MSNNQNDTIFLAKLKTGEWIQVFYMFAIRIDDKVIFSSVIPWRKNMSRGQTFFQWGFFTTDKFGQYIPISASKLKSIKLGKMSLTDYIWVDEVDDLIEVKEEDLFIVGRLLEIINR